jgi:hypothetical protein
VHLADLNLVKLPVLPLLIALALALPVSALIELVELALVPLAVIVRGHGRLIMRGHNSHLRLEDARRVIHGGLGRACRVPVRRVEGRGRGLTLGEEGVRGATAPGGAGTPAHQVRVGGVLGCCGLGALGLIPGCRRFNDL